MTSKSVSFASHANVAVHKSVVFDDNGVFRRMLDWKKDHSYAMVGYSIYIYFFVLGPPLFLLLSIICF